MMVSTQRPPLEDAILLMKAGRHTEAIEAARRTVAAMPHQPLVQYNFGVMLQEVQDWQGACDAFSAALRSKPDLVQALNNRGMALEALGRLAEATADYRRALDLRPAYAAVMRNLGGLLLSQGDADAALSYFIRLLAADPQDQAARLKVARALRQLGRLDEARRALSEAPVEDRRCLFELAQVCLEMNDSEAARRHFRRLEQIDPDDWRAKLEARLALPAIYSSAAELTLARDAFAGGLAELERASKTAVIPIDRRLAAVERDNFYLAYQGENDRELQVRYAGLVAAILGDTLADGPQLLSRNGGKPRIGFASCFFRDCTVGHYFKSWVTDLPAATFDKYVYALDGSEDSLTAEIRSGAHCFRRPAGGLQTIARDILADQLDVLIYPELGMNGLTYALAAFRLAKVQCAGWGHPVSSGHRSIDYYLSSAIMEPSNADEHYSETLIRLPGLGTRYQRPPAAAAVSREELGLPADAHLYLFPHSLFKIHPDNDAILARILAQDPQGRLVLFAGENRWVTEAYLNRLYRELTSHGVDRRRIHVLPLVSRPKFLGVNRLCDVMIDARRWSGGNTSLDALASGLPIVTWRGDLMRGRQTAGMLERLGLPELIADDDERFVAIASQLGCDPVLRMRTSANIDTTLDRLFDDAAFLLSVTA